MKYIVGISVVATLGAVLVYQSQNSTNTEVKNLEVTNESTTPNAVKKEVAIEEVADQPQDDILLSAVQMANANLAKEKASEVAEAETSKPIITKNTVNTKKAAKKKIAKKAVKKSDKSDELTTSQAAAVNKTVISIKKAEEKKKEKKFTNILDVSFNTDTKETTDGDKGYDTQLWYFLYYKMNSEYTARLWAIVNKDLADSYEEKIGDTRITFSKKSLELSDRLKLSPSITTVLPTSEKSKRNEELNFGLEFNASLSYRLTNDLSISYLPRVVKNFHEYKTSRTNGVNTEYKIVQFYAASYAISEKWSFDPTLIYSTTWSYSGRRRNPSYTSILEIGYSVNDTVSLAMGTIQGGSVFDRENGPNEQIELYDENESTIYGNFALRF